MFHVQDQNDVVYADEYSQSTSYLGRRYDEKLDDAIRLDEAKQAVIGTGYSDFCKPVEDWMLD